MNYSSAIGLINNAALLLALCLLYDMLGPRLQERKTIIQQILTGIVLGAIGLAIMFNPWNFGQGIVFDTRSVLLVFSSTMAACHGCSRQNQLAGDVYIPNRHGHPRQSYGDE